MGETINRPRNATISVAELGGWLAGRGHTHLKNETNA